MLSLLNAEDPARLVEDAKRVRENMVADYCNPLGIILENKF